MKSSNERCYVCGTNTCGLEYTNPTPTKEELKSFYSVYGDIRANPNIVKLNAEEHFKTLSKYGLTDTSKTLDFGTGPGTFVDVAGECCFGVDLKHSGHPRIKEYIEDFKDISSWDFITLWGVIEHLPDPMTVMQKLVSQLRRGGAIALTTVDAESVIPYYYKPPEHLSYWTRTAFEILADICGLEIIDYRPYKMFQIGEIYFDRLLSRTPDEYIEMIINKLPEIVKVPTNEVFVVMQKK